MATLSIARRRIATHGVTAALALAALAGGRIATPEDRTSTQDRAASGPSLRPGGRVGSVAVRDLNGDRHPDIVAARLDTGTLSVYLGDGTGAFREAEGSPFAAGPTPDLAVAHYQVGPAGSPDRVTVLLGRGSGVFVPAPGSPFPTGTSSTAVAIGDVDGDGVDDVAVANLGSNDVTVVRGGASGLRPANGSPFRVGDGPTSVALADVNGDRRADIVTANWGSGDVTVVMSR